MLKHLISRLDADSTQTRLAALEEIQELESFGKLNGHKKIGPVLPNYIHIHTTASYGLAVPGVFSVSHMIWAAHEARAHTALLIEHESTSHLEEARAAVEIVNNHRSQPMRLILGVEFKAPIAIDDLESRRFSDQIGQAWGQNEAAWVVGVGISENRELQNLVAQFQEAKRWKATQQIDKLRRHLGISHPLELSAFLTPEGNLTDRSLSFALAKMKCPQMEGRALERNASTIRKLFNPGEAGYVPFPKGLLSYQQVIRKLADMNSVPTFTSQLHGVALQENMQLLKSWGIRALDIAGIEPGEADAEERILQSLELAKQYNLLIFGGADYRGFGTGWLKHSPWMEHPIMLDSIDQLIGSNFGNAKEIQLKKSPSAD